MSRFTTGIAEIVLIVEDVARSAEFYEQVVGLEPVSRTGDEWAWFLAGDPGTQQRIAVHKGSLLFDRPALQVSYLSTRDRGAGHWGS